MLSLVRSAVTKMQSCQQPIRRKSYKSLIVDKRGHVTTIGINRPEKRNCIDNETAKELKEAIELFENDEESYVGVLYGCGGNFCAGYDLKELSSVNDDSAIQTLYTETGTVGPTLRFIKKPMVAAIDGYAVAGGLELALMCDLRVIEENAIMGVFCRRFGVPLMDGGTVRLQAIVGLSRALDFILTGRPIAAKEAFEVGLANRVVAVGTVLGQAINLATSLVKFPQQCMNVDRKSTYNAAFATTYEKLLEYERDNAWPVILKESVSGAKRFVSGIGKHGSTHNLTERPIPEWERSENNLVPKNKL